MDRSSGLLTEEDKLWSGLSYAGIVCALVPTLLIFLLKRDESSYLKFNTLQALALSVFSVVGIMALYFMGRFAGFSSGIGLAILLFSVSFVGIWIYLMVRAFSGQNTRLPLLGPVIEAYWMG